MFLIKACKLCSIYFKCSKWFLQSLRKSTTTDIYTTKCLDQEWNLCLDAQFFMFLWCIGKTEKLLKKTDFLQVN